LATLVLALNCELCARLFKQPATVFLIPGIIPLVPGLGMYQGMKQIIEKSYEPGMNTLLTAGTDSAAIALGIMFTASIFRVLKMSANKKFGLNKWR
ncbi:MAG: threonine/serine exporter family protein, partial [Phascolarctobacterium sp.]|nr:threonine/serine exporter family protein [Phascolarctobacterium sp.]